MFTNAVCLLNKRFELQLRLNQLQSKPDIIGVVEVKPKNYKELPQLPEYNLEDYDVHCSNTDSTQGRGIIFYTAPWLKASCYNLHPNDSNVLESLWITVSLRDKDRLLIGCMYRSPNSSVANDEQLNKQIKLLYTSTEASHILLMGDFNYSNIDWELGRCSTTPSERLFMKTVNDSFLHQHVNSPTRARQNLCVQLFLTSYL